jgi:mRNA interferase MazF
MMRQGEIWYVDLNPVRGSEQAGFRPVVIISGNMLNALAPVVICCPLTTQLKRYKGNLILEPSETNGLQQSSEVLTSHIRSISKTRFVKVVGNLQPVELLHIQQTLSDLMRY